VVKPALSRYLYDDRVRATSVAVVAEPRGLERVLQQQWVDHMACLVQSFIPGSGAGVFTIFAHDGPVGWFAHKRLREKPPRGGVSVLSESGAVNESLRAGAETLLRRIDWFGPAMVEFRVDPEGRPWFMEINARLWGSLQLAVDCDFDFPWLWYQLFLGREVRPVESYRLGRRLRWELGDLDHLLLQVRGKGTAQTAWARLTTALRCINPAAGRPEILRADDPRPFLHELRGWLRAARATR
jgi:predicted ATP-grasp superfamily ATP-dependent carboligase